jgi:DNA segregation ATPase FtsK/SpoIIIE-like protein
MRKSNERLRHQLEVQSIQIEEFLNRHEVPAEVAGGMVRSRWVSFDLNTQIAAGIEKLRGLRNELASTLGASDVSITHYDDRLRIAVKQPDSHPVDLLDLMDALPESSPMTATLGLDEADRPVLLNLLADDIVNILVAGGPEAGKTALLRTFALSLALENRQSQIQMAILDVAVDGRSRNRKPSLYPLNYLPHVMFTVVETLREAAEALNFLVSEVEYRIEQEVTWPLLVLMIDDVDQLVEMGGRPIIEPLTYLLEEGVNAGMRIVLGASNPDSNAIRPLLKNSVPVRLVGQLSDATTARAITGIPDSQAEYLRGQGDFIAVSNGMVLPFQAAFITDYDLHLVLDKLHRQSQPVMVAQPLTVRPTLAPPDEEHEQAQFFEFNSQDRRANLGTPGNSSRYDSPPQVIEATNRPNVRRWDEKEGRIEEAVWEEIDEDEDDWEAEAEDEENETIIDIWAGFEDKSEDEDDDWEEDDDETDTAIEVWSTPKKPDNGRAVTKSDSQEIEFDWD